MVFHCYWSTVPVYILAELLGGRSTHGAFWACLAPRQRPVVAANGALLSGAVFERIEDRRLATQREDCSASSLLASKEDASLANWHRKLGASAPDFLQVQPPQRG